MSRARDIASAAVNRGVGTVSQVGGVPTGAIIESGSNADGSYVRFADGTQICWAYKTGGASAAVTFTLPAAFIDNLYSVTATISGSNTTSDLKVKVGTTAATTCEFATLNGAAFSALTFRYMAIGRWY